MKPRISIVRRLFSILFVMFFFIANSQNSFIENKGQLPKSVISKTNLPSGALFIEKNKLIYAFYDGNKLSRIHNGEANNFDIDAHAYSVSFIGANKNVSVELNGASNYFENYYLGDRSSWVSNVLSFKSQTQKEIYPCKKFSG